MPANEVHLPDGRVMTDKEFEQRRALLSKPFDQSEIEKLPRQMKRDDQNRAQCREGTVASADGYFCGGYHARSIHLDYVGHAGITDRLNEVDPFWVWEPMALTAGGTPLMSDGGMWGKLTVLGVTRIGYGDPGRNSGPNAIKEMIGDFLRNAAMRHGVGTYLWSKSEAALLKKRGEEPDENQEPAEQAAPAVKPWTRATVENRIKWEKGNLDGLKTAWREAKAAGTETDLLKLIEDAAKPTEKPIEGTVIP
ncbi:hypothetical protein [Psychromicrobium lacuslunae]|uniref:hypothetical protein n=1 Tax=Psychromicrobium lacuslunae TaxID=1618207 RepID=UPI0006971B82|nr:hypothetical protein [Psychromicrobium lacuslunae]